MLIRPTLTTLRCGRELLDVSSARVAGIINVTPDSFYSPSRVPRNGEFALDMGCQMVNDGATILDIGGMSSRPGAELISVGEEIDRVIPVIESFAKYLPHTMVSIDTDRSEVAEAAILAGATIVNDISGGSRDQRMWDVVCKYPVTYVVMHMRGTPVNMQSLTQYQDLIGDLLKYFVNKLRELHQLGINDIIIDPGFGFSKTIEQNYEIIENLSTFRMLGYPIMIGISRKSSLSLTIHKPVNETLDATTALHMAALIYGASILRVHDVKPAMDAIAVFKKLQEAKNH